jgi:hypothetical protein
MPRQPIDPCPILPARVRQVGSDSFGFLPHRFLRDGFLCSLTADELRLYIMLVLAADRNGGSFYSHRRLCQTLDLSADAYLRARDCLVRKELIAVDGIKVQVLSLPAAPVLQPPTPQLPRNEQRAACSAILSDLAAPNRGRE